MSVTQVVKIEGMMCQGCAHHIEEALKRIPGVNEVKVSLERKEAVVKAKGNIAPETYRKAVEEAGYTFIEAK